MGRVLCAIAVAACASCGGHPGATVEPATALHITTSGAGVVRGAGADCRGACTPIFAKGVRLELTAVPDAGAMFTGWSGACSGTSACELSTDVEATVAATFVPAPGSTVALTANVSGPGTVTGPSLNCGADSACSGPAIVGTTVTLSAAADPAARFMGWSGACSGTAPTCDVAVQNDTFVTAIFEYVLQTLVANDNHNLSVLALNSTSVFFGRSTSDRNGIWSVPKAGGMPQFVAAGAPAAIVADDTYVYWTDNIGLYSAPAGGGRGSLLATGVVGHPVLDTAGALYWIANATDPSGATVHRMQDRIDAIIASGQHPNGGIAVDETYVYFACSTIDGVERAIRRVPKNGGPVETVVTAAAAPIGVRIDSSNIYFNDSTAAVWAVDKASGLQRRLNAANGAGWLAFPGEFEVNGSVVWWLWIGTTDSRGLFRANADATGFSAVDVSSDGWWTGLGVDDAAVYYFHAGALLRRLK